MFICPSNLYASKLTLIIRLQFTLVKCFLKIKTSEKEPGVVAIIPRDSKLKLNLSFNCYGHEIINFKKNIECISLI